ncbi:hypothetical protein [Amycolatopsis sp. NPDC098790]
MRNGRRRASIGAALIAEAAGDGTRPAAVRDDDAGRSRRAV